LTPGGDPLASRLPARLLAHPELGIVQAGSAGDLRDLRVERRDLGERYRPTLGYGAESGEELVTVRRRLGHQITLAPVRIRRRDRDLETDVLRIVGWRATCGCGRRSRVKRTPVLARADLIASHPWRRPDTALP
jgi:hypothetical protein